MEQVWKHPETREGEVLLRNMKQAEFDQLDFSTKRQGQLSYDGEGHQLSHSDWLPAFLKKDELNNRGIDLQTIRKIL